MVGLHLHFDETLTYMAGLIRANPNITVRQLAKEMKFADGKSVYYWLGKSNFSGIREFKELILKEDFDNLEGVSIQENDKSMFLLRIPWRDWCGKSKETGARWFHFFHDNPNPRGLFTMTISTNDYYPWFSQDDQIIVNTTRQIRTGSWVLLKQGRYYFLGRAGADKNIYAPHSLQPYSLSVTKALGVIITLQRNLL